MDEGKEEAYRAKNSPLDLKSSQNDEDNLRLLSPI